MAEPLAFLLTWTTYGTWLHGDERGSVDRPESQLSTPRLEPRPGLARFERSELKNEPIIFGSEARAVVHEIIQSHAQFRGWPLHALNVRTNHVHLVVSCRCPPEKAMGEFKAWATRRLREQGHIAPGARTWTRHGSTRYLTTTQSVDGAIRYVLDGQ